MASKALLLLFATVLVFTVRASSIDDHEELKIKVTYVKAPAPQPLVKAPASPPSSSATSSPKTPEQPDHVVVEGVVYCQSCLLSLCLGSTK
ncbi:hypothetical protein TB2_007606 [Malus domestica]